LKKRDCRKGKGLGGGEVLKNAREASH